MGAFSLPQPRETTNSDDSIRGLRPSRGTTASRTRLTVRCATPNPLTEAESAYYVAGSLAEEVAKSGKRERQRERLRETCLFFHLRHFLVFCFTRGWVLNR